MKVLNFIITILVFYVEDKIILSILSRGYGKKCKYDCSKCGMWSCTNETNYKNYIIPPYDNYKNVCGKLGCVKWKI